MMKLNFSGGEAVLEGGGFREGRFGRVYCMCWCKLFEKGQIKSRRVIFWASDGPSNVIAASSEFESLFSIWIFARRISFVLK